MKTLRLTVAKGRECYYLTIGDEPRKVCGSFPSLCLAIVAVMRERWGLDRTSK